MKKQLIGYCIVIFLFTIGIIPTKIPHTIVNAVEQEESKQKSSVQEMETQEATSAVVIIKKSNYVLPYPGILQNHPLYVIKELRDKIIETLIVDPLRKSEFYLLQSDKWIAAAEMLAAQNQQEEAQKVFDASAIRMNMSVNQLQHIKDSGRDIPSGTIDKIENSIEKHLEITDEFSVGNVIEPNQSRQLYITLQEQIDTLR